MSEKPTVPDQPPAAPTPRESLAARIKAWLEDGTAGFNQAVELLGEAEAALSADPRPSLERLVAKWNELGEREMEEAADKPAAMLVAAMRIHCAMELAAALRSTGEP